MTRTLRAGIIGPGFIGTVHARAVLAAGGVLTRVAASTFEQAASAAERLMIDHPAASAEELISAPDVDGCLQEGDDARGARRLRHGRGGCGLLR